MPLCALFVCLLAGCTIVTPPQSVSDPIAVHYADYGFHSSLLLPTGDGRWVEYSFGDWHWAAENHNKLWNACGALFFSGQASLGRKFHDISPGEQTPVEEGVTPDMTVIYAERGDVAALVADWGARYQRGSQPPLHNSRTGLYQVRDAEHYSLFNSCNHMTADGLRRLGCRTWGISVFATFQFKDQPMPAVPIPATQPAIAP